MLIMFNKLHKCYISLNLKIFIFIYLTLHLTIKYIMRCKFRKKIGVISCNHHANIGNNLVKYAVYTFLSKYGFQPEIIGTNRKNFKLSFLKKYVNFRTVNDFSEIKQNEYDGLMVNSDQSWRKFDKDFYDIAFLKFAHNWDINKFTYAVSLGFNNWQFSENDEKIAKELLQHCTGISVREKNSFSLI